MGSPVYGVFYWSRTMSPANTKRLFVWPKGESRSVVFTQCEKHQQLFKSRMTMSPANTKKDFRMAKGREHERGIYPM
ncbi:hypothetical protein T01_5922 [Trichinella spiralis]|uniref:Uncharacterized protein n=1 Tax=Trichinella spiralis TaxID=6334 RepID=A0A0V1AXV8_TRISP|nr:hypothetical protein T01_5922 [Trichinella spiralis]